MNKMKLFCAAACAAFGIWAAEETPRISRYTLPGLPKTVYYDAPHPIAQGSPCTLAVVLVHGWGGGGEVAPEMAPMMKALRKAMGEKACAPYVVAPLFPRQQSLARAKIPVDDRARWNDSWSANLAQPGVPDDDFRGGGDAAGTKMSSFEIVDGILATLGDKTRFPNLTRVVVTGFSAGGQFVGRYVAVGKGFVRDGVSVVYAAMAPSTELYFDENVVWHYGLKGRPRYAARLSCADIMKNLASRRVWRACGAQDTHPRKGLDRTPAAMAQGTNRYARFRNFEAYLKRYPEWARQVSFHAFEGLDHNTAKAHASDAFIAFALGR